jgi:hypothetical protein
VTDKEQLEALRRENWDDIWPSVLRSALILSARYGWTAASSLPNGKTVEDLIIEAINDLFAHPERRKPDVKIVTQLRNMVRSKLWNLSQSVDSDIERSGEIGEVAVSAEQQPCEVVESKNSFDTAISLLAKHPKVKGKNDHELLLYALSDGADLEDVECIVDVTGLTRDRIYQVRRELRDIFPQIARQIENGEGANETGR